MEVINNRRSIRTFKECDVDFSLIEKLLRAAMQAPSAGNQRPWEFVVVKDKNKLDELSRMSPYATPIKNAPAAIMVLCNNDFLRFPENLEQDLGAATENLLLEAVDLGLGAVWLGVMPLEDRIKYIKQALALPDNVVPYAVVPVGYPLDENANKFIDRYDENRVHFESY